MQISLNKPPTSLGDEHEAWPSVNRPVPPPAAAAKALSQPFLTSSLVQLPPRARSPRPKSHVLNIYRTQTVETWVKQRSAVVSLRPTATDIAPVVWPTDPHSACTAAPTSAFPRASRHHGTHRPHLPHPRSYPAHRPPAPCCSTTHHHHHQDNHHAPSPPPRPPVLPDSTVTHARGLYSGNNARDVSAYVCPAGLPNRLPGRGGNSGSDHQQQRSRAQ